MIRFIRGVPGSGKSYYAVNYLLKFCEYDKLYESYSVKSGSLLITNIENLNINHLDLDTCITKYTLEKFFTVENFEKIRDVYRVQNIIVVIDECQRYFPIDYRVREVLYFFQYHRHLGVDVILLSQTVKTVTFALVALSEYIIEAMPRSKGVFGVFRYQFYDIRDNYLYTETVKKTKNVFRAYTSFIIDEVSKPKNIYMRYFFMIIGLIALCIFIISFGLSSMFDVPVPQNNVSVEPRITPLVSNSSQVAINTLNSLESSLTAKFALTELVADYVLQVTSKDNIIYYAVINGIKSKVCVVQDISTSLVSCPQYELDRIDKIAGKRSLGGAVASNGENTTVRE